MVLVVGIAATVRRLGCIAPDHIPYWCALMKPVYVLVRNGGDGSSYPYFTMNEDYINQLQMLHDTGVMDYEDGYSDGDGFHYGTFQVPDDLTLAQMGLSDCASNLDEYLNGEEEE